MNDISSERSKQPWDIYTSSDPTPAQTGVDRDQAPWKSFGTSMNAISFGFVATAILISMFLIMAIFEHLFKPSPSFSSPEDMTNGSLESGTFQKCGNPQTVCSHQISTLDMLHHEFCVLCFYFAPLSVLILLSHNEEEHAV